MPDTVKHELYPDNAVDTQKYVAEKTKEFSPHAQVSAAAAATAAAVVVTAAAEITAGTHANDENEDYDPPVSVKTTVIHSDSPLIN